MEKKPMSGYGEGIEKRHEGAEVFRISEDDEWHKTRAIRVALAPINISPEQMGGYTDKVLDDVYDEYHELLSATTTDLAEFSTSLKENRDFAHFKLSSDLDQELTFVRKKMTEEDVVVSGIFNGRETSSQSGPEQWSPVVCTTVRDLVRRHKVLVSAGIPPQTATELAATWSMSAGVCMAIAKRAFRQISDKKDFEGENVEFMQRLFYSAGSIRDSLEFVYDSMESVYMRSLAEGMALEIIATQMDAMDLGDQNKSKLFTDELRTRSLGYMQRKYELTSDYVDLEEVAAVTSFSRQEIMRFFGA